MALKLNGNSGNQGRMFAFHSSHVMPCGGLIS